eukprot:s1327_g6.t1
MLQTMNYLDLDASPSPFEARVKIRMPLWRRQSTHFLEGMWMVSIRNIQMDSPQENGQQVENNQAAES